MEYLTLAAILIGPIIAVWMTRYLDDRRERHHNRMDIFRTLMRTRRTPVFPEHVGALNLIEIEFAKDKAVIAAWKALYQHLGTEHTRRPDEQTIGLPPNQTATRNEKFFDRLAQERQSLLAKLLHAMAKVMNFKVEQLEIFEGGYYPQGWDDEFREQRLMRRYVIELAAGRNSVPVAAVNDGRENPAS